MQVVNWPFFLGRPSAPGYVPKNWSKERFSIMITTTCWILWIPVTAAAGFDAAPNPTEQAVTVPHAKDIARKTNAKGRGASRAITVTSRMLASPLSLRFSTLTSALPSFPLCAARYVRILQIRTLKKRCRVKYRRLGKTGYSVSEVGFGAWQIGGDWGDVDESTALETLQAAVDTGVTFFDTADVYGDGRSERVIGRFR